MKHYEGIRCKNMLLPNISRGLKSCFIYIQYFFQKPFITFNNTAFKFYIVFQKPDSLNYNCMYRPYTNLNKVS